MTQRRASLAMTATIAGLATAATFDSASAQRRDLDSRVELGVSSIHGEDAVLQVPTAQKRSISRGGFQFNGGVRRIGAPRFSGSVRGNFGGGRGRR
jgi:hypothetical protein